jgi:putative membrane protein
VNSADPPPPDGDDAALARDHLANERTYLAWLRTAVNVMILGLAVAKLIHGTGSRADIAGGILIAVGFVVLAYGTIHWRRITRQLRAGTFEVDQGGPLVIAGLVTAGVAAAAVLLFA